MNAEERRKYILEKLKDNSQPISASTFGKELSVSRQVIVNDIALLRAVGEKITALPRGYVLEKESNDNYVIACKHSKSDLSEELYTIVEYGCGIIDVIIEHDIYGEIKANLCIYSKNDVDEFLAKIKDSNTKPLCILTNDYHFHTLSCPTKEHFEKVRLALINKGLCVLTPN